VLDVGPFKNVQPDEEPTEGDIYPEPYIYTTVDKVSSGDAATTPATATQLEPEMDASMPPSGEMEEQQGGTVVFSEEEATTSFDGNLVRL